MNEAVKRIITGCVLAFLFFGTAWYNFMLFCLLIVAGMIEIVLFEWPQLVGGATTWRFWLITPLYPLFPFCCFFVLLSLAEPGTFLDQIYIFLLAATHDIGAYTGGTLIGRHKIAPTISPKKTWEGLFAGFCAVTLFNYTYFTYQLTLYPKSVLFSWGLFTHVLFGLFATFCLFTGDLFVSFLKRRAGIKDTASFLPGHGGLLDRADSLLFLSVGLVCLILIYSI